MQAELFYLLMQDHWSAEDYAYYDELTRKQAPKATPQKPQVYEVGDTKTDESGTWKKIDENTWVILY